MPMQKEIEWDAVRAMLGQESRPSISNACSSDVDAPLVQLVGHRSMETAQVVVNKLKERGICVIKAGAD
ncbi:unnamed protein product, partial [Symbiodinium sp. CCMP2456]